jgi:hypothetical protein
MTIATPAFTHFPFDRLQPNPVIRASKYLRRFPDDQSNRQLIVFWSNRRATARNYCENAARSKWFMKICINAVR